MLNVDRPRNETTFSDLLEWKFLKDQFIVGFVLEHRVSVNCGQLFDNKIFFGNQTDGSGL